MGAGKIDPAVSVDLQADILESVSRKFFGEYEWIERAGMHACDIGIIMKESAREMKLAAEEIRRLRKEGATRA